MTFKTIVCYLWGRSLIPGSAVQHYNTPMNKARSIKKWKRFSQFAVKELDWPAQSPDPNPIQDLWDSLKHRRRTKHQEINLTALERKSLQPGPKSFGITSQKSGGYCSSKLMPMVLVVWYRHLSVITLVIPLLVCHHHQTNIWVMTKYLN